MASVLCITLGVIGALFSEAAKQYQKWYSMDEAIFRQQFASVKFWCTVVFLAAVGGVAAALLEWDTAGTAHPPAYVAVGAGALAFFRNLASAAVAPFSPSGNLGQRRSVTWFDVWA